MATDNQTASKKKPSVIGQIISLVGLGIFVWFGFKVFNAFSSHDQRNPPTPAALSQPAALPPQAALSPPIPLPDVELRFVKVVADFAGQFSDAPNEMAAGGLRSVRARALCDVLRHQTAVRNWVGQVYSLDHSPSGKGVLTMQISEQAQIGTDAVEIPGDPQHTVLQPGSSVFQQAAALKEGQYAIFDGNLFSDPADCVHETSFSLDGGMKEPKFLIRFSAIRPVP